MQQSLIWPLHFNSKEVSVKTAPGMLAVCKVAMEAAVDKLEEGAAEVTTQEEAVAVVEAKIFTWVRTHHNNGWHSLMKTNKESGRDVLTQPAKGNPRNLAEEQEVKLNVASQQ